MLVKAVSEGGPLAASGEDGLWATALCEAACRSVERGVPVAAREFLPPPGAGP